MKFPVSPRITVHPAICQGQPIVWGLRYPVWQVLEWLASGTTETAIRAKCPELETEDFRACLAFAAARFKPLDYFRTNSQEEDSEEWVQSRQSQWLAEQSFLKRLREPSHFPLEAASVLKSEVPNKNSR